MNILKVSAFFVLSGLLGYVMSVMPLPGLITLLYASLFLFGFTVLATFICILTKSNFYRIPVLLSLLLICSFLFMRISSGIRYHYRKEAGLELLKSIESHKSRGGLYPSVADRNLVSEEYLHYYPDSSLQSFTIKIDVDGWTSEQYDSERKSWYVAD